MLDGADPAQFPRYVDLVNKNPLYQDWIKSANERDDSSTKSRGPGSQARPLQGRATM